ncbi:MAG: hypothetical protein ACR2ME_02085 [Acidimicrobiia bacterium]
MGQTTSIVCRQHVTPFKKHVTFGFYYGGELPDPAGLLPTKGGCDRC